MILSCIADSDVSDLLHNLETQDLQVEMMKQSDYMSAAPHSAAINVTGNNKVSEHIRDALLL